MDNIKKKETFTVKIDDKDVELAVLLPSAKIYRDAQLEYNKIFNRLLRAGTILNKELEDEMRKRGIWDDEKEEEHNKLRKSLADGELLLSKGDVKLSKAYDTALQMRKCRFRWRELVMDRVAMQSNTAEAQAENARFNFLLQQCLVYNTTGELYYKTLDEYYESGNEEAAMVGAVLLGKLTTQYNNLAEADLPENKFLKEYNFTNDKLQLVDKTGKLVDDLGRLIDDEGFLLDDNGNRIDHNGNPIGKDGKYIVDFKPFLDDDGNPIIK